MPLLKNKFQFARRLIKSNLNDNENSTHSLLEILPKIAFWSQLSCFLVKQDFHRNFWGQLYMYFFSHLYIRLLDWIVLIPLWFERPLPPNTCPWPFKKWWCHKQSKGRWSARAGAGGSGANEIRAYEKWTIFFKLCLLTSADECEP